MSSNTELKELSNVSNRESNVRVPRWYFGGLSSAFAATFSHPIDTMKGKIV